MSRQSRFLILLALAIAVPATAHTIGFSIGGSEPAACLSLGNATYRLAALGARADFTVRIDAAAVSPDMRIQLSDKPDEADLVLVDDGDALPSCRSRGPGVKHVKIDAEAVKPDVVVALAPADAPADYRIYVRTRDLAPTTAAALFAAAQLAARRLAARVGDHSN